MAPRRTFAATLLTVLTMGLLIGGCGGTTLLHSSKPSPPPSTTPRATAPGQPSAPPGQGGGRGPQALPAPVPTGIPASSQELAVIRGWSRTLRRGDVVGAARFFALPSVLINGTGQGGTALGVAIRTLHDAIAANTELPCGAQFISADQRGRYVNALFRLTNRPGPGAGCGAGAGQTARTNFVISAGRIVHWIRAPDDPGDNGHGTPLTPSGSPNAPVV